MSDPTMGDVITRQRRVLDRILANIVFTDGPEVLKEIEAMGWRPIDQSARHVIEYIRNYSGDESPKLHINYLPLKEWGMFQVCTAAYNEIVPLKYSLHSEVVSWAFEELSWLHKLESAYAHVIAEIQRQAAGDILGIEP